MISIIIPVLNEETYIGKLLEYLLANSSAKNISEIIVIDGGSFDDTRHIVQAFSNFTGIKNKAAFNFIDKTDLNDKSILNQVSKTQITLLNSEKGRAKQMNLGAKSATGDILYFLHADSLPPKHFDQFIIREVKNKNEAGCFRMQFDSNHWWLSLASWLTKFRWRACRGGDQSQFITKKLFNNIGGFNEKYIIYEDNILINELYARNQFVIINEKLITSARMYRKYGIWKLQYIYWSIYLKKWFGADCDALYNYYKKNIC
ncbi:MAG: TIGR04283 family arsenosugar biosynthesis glycosyltransferase [Algibacter sp.]|uniref:TIGR04283 family arsenosugar biosynthesis glycosyltransferase n=1 Tax=Algibacter sp. TaxID=1872428 RepID=UPI00261BD434|nr:TIGR04283 family arsenosugar biosynthesis glycosyltransferase [Algibacter sp.]MDG1730158.1 TIGR04283 family arsenosugar biosynthesis glycosyltransferase [Algibacter sp.]MDG2179455.1 TIGR04283 family arsenosugar biosynthesis glycosyltransferase [Algibacter sp.]